MWVVSPFKKYSITILVLILSVDLNAQNNFLYPIPFSQYFNYQSFINPAATALDNKAALRLGERLNAAPFNRIRTFFAIGEFSLKNDAGAGHGIGLSIMSHKEGPLFSINRVYAQYAYHLNISEEWKFSSGASFGYLNFSVDPSPTSAGVSSYSPDGSIGLLLYRDIERIGISSSQIFNNSIEVISKPIPVKRYYNFFYLREIIVSPGSTFIPSVLYTLKNERSELDVSGSFLMNNILFAGLSYQLNKGTAYFLGIKDFNFLSGYTDLTFSYNSPWPSKNLRNIHSFEIMLAYKLDKNR
ncbi:PorP/SprF family type IX secretion system membrane protein [Sporocytophaga myxococcoides]|uniref:PorP/SprF family type IX secretion system membrane protein n=1 Tax=Sporocytophaga myxococcoides TaxID=153721 RepID=UPI000421850B|nr:PorP/SprF family type IX secretion system membrane protein [Sporocytophaga myxococcoides]